MIIGSFEQRNQEEKAGYNEVKSAVAQRQRLAYTSKEAMAKLNDLKYELLHQFIFSRPVSQRLLIVSQLEKVAPEEGICVK